MTVSSSSDIQLRQLLLVLLGLGLGAAFVGQLIMVGIAPDRQAAVLVALMDWTPWLVVAPAVFWFASRVPFGRQNIRWALPAHVLACALSIGLHVLIGYGVGNSVLRLGLLESRAVSNSTASLSPGGARDATGLMPRFFRARYLAAIYIALVASASAAAHYQQRLERERHVLQAETKLAEARLMALQMQLQPHFLFNTLHTISSLVYTRPEAADAMICALSDLLRSVLQTSQQREVTVEQEMRFVRSYLAIQQMRLNERLQWHCEIAAAAGGAAVPALILQPLVENAILHGIAPSGPGGKVLVTAVVNGNRLDLAVTNSGLLPKRESGVPPGSKGVHHGIGLDNTRSRLTAIYGDDFQLVLEPRDGEVCASISIPFRMLA